MGQAGPAVGEITREEELRRIEDLQNIIGAFDRIQAVLGGLASRNELKDAEGHRCLLVVLLSHHENQRYYFEVAGGRIVLTSPFNVWNTKITAPLQVVIRVFDGIWQGEHDPFGDEKAHGLVKIEGERKVHDLVSFQDAFKRVSGIIRRYREAP